MKTVLIFLLISIIFLQVSCKNTILRITGFRVPKVENKSSVFKYLEKLDQDTFEVYALDSALFQKLKKEKFKPGMEQGFRPIQIRMYDKHGKPVMQWTICEGLLKDLNLFDTIPPKILNGLDTTLTLHEDISRYFTLDGNHKKIEIPAGFDYYVLIYFAKYFPKHSRESFTQIDRYIRNHPETTFKIYKINVDVQEFWNTEIEVDTKAQIGGNN